MLGSLTLSGTMMSGINAMSSDAQLKYTAQATEGAPVPVVIAQSIGVLRGIIVNYMWIRADKLKEDGKFFEAYHLSRWITQLQPRFAKVWSFHAWNMAYNISVATNTKEERWQWVNEGINLIRKYGIKYNPNDMMLYKELSWCFLHKVGGLTDDAHYYYKQQLADEWHSILGAPPYEHTDVVAWIGEVAQAPERLDDLIEAHPETEDLLQDMKAAGLELNTDFLHIMQRIESIKSSYLAQRTDLYDRLLKLDQDEVGPDLNLQDRQMLGLIGIVENENYTEALPALLGYTRKQVIRTEYNMDPMFMHDLTVEFGPLDWRSPNAHALYWAYVGVARGLSRRQQALFDRINTDRLLFHSEQALQRRGHIYFDFMTKELTWTPDLRFIPFYEHVFDILLAREMGTDDPRGPKPQTFIDGYRNFLIDAVRQYYQWGEYEKADEYYTKLRMDPQMQEMGREERFTYPIQEFILRETWERYDSPDVVFSEIMGLLNSAFRFGLAYGKKDAFDARCEQAQLIYENFDEQYGDVKTNFSTRNRLAIWPWADPQSVTPCMISVAFESAMNFPGTTMEERMRMWLNAEDWVKAKTYANLENALGLYYENMAASMGGAIPLTLEEAFPPPPASVLKYYDNLRQQERPDTPKDQLQMERK